jgi:hypothetical protein
MCFIDRRSLKYEQCHLILCIFVSIHFSDKTLLVYSDIRCSWRYIGYDLVMTLKTVFVSISST